MYIFTFFSYHKFVNETTVCVMTTGQHEILFKRRLMPKAVLHNLTHLEESVS